MIQTISFMNIKIIIKIMIMITLFSLVVRLLGRRLLVILTNPVTALLISHHHHHHHHRHHHHHHHPHHHHHGDETFLIVMSSYQCDYLKYTLSSSFGFVYITVWVSVLFLKEDQVLAFNLSRLFVIKSYSQHIASIWISRKWIRIWFGGFSSKSTSILASTFTLRLAIW